MAIIRLKKNGTSEYLAHLGVSKCWLVTSLKRNEWLRTLIPIVVYVAAKEKIRGLRWNTVNSYLAGSYRLARYEQLRINVVEVPLERLAAEFLPQGLPFRYVSVLALRKLRIISPEILPATIQGRKEGREQAGLRIGGKGCFRKAGI